MLRMYVDCKIILLYIVGRVIFQVSQENLIRYILKILLYFELNFMFFLNIRFLSFYLIICKFFWFKLLFYLKNNVFVCSLYIYEVVMKIIRLYV